MAETDPPSQSLAEPVVHPIWCTGEPLCDVGVNPGGAHESFVFQIVSDAPAEPCHARIFLSQSPSGNGAVLLMMEMAHVDPIDDSPEAENEPYVFVFSMAQAEQFRGSVDHLMNQTTARPLAVAIQA